MKSTGSVLGSSLARKGPDLGVFDVGLLVAEFSDSVDDFFESAPSGLRGARPDVEVTIEVELSATDSTSDSTVTTEEILEPGQL